MSHVAFLGTGLLGSGMVENLLRRGERVTVWNRTSEKARALASSGATVAPSPEQAVRAASRVHMVFSDDAVVDAMVERIRPSLGAGTIVVDHTTTGPELTKARLQRAAGAGMPLIHAPVFMSPQMCRDGIGLMLASGPSAVFNDVAPHLQKMTGEVWYLGERADLAAAYKLFGNSMLFVITAGLVDVFAMARNVGVSAQDAAALFSRFKIGGIVAQRAEKIAKGDFSATFELTMARKDIRLMLEAAGAEPLLVLPHLAARMDAAIAAGHGAQDMGVIAADLVEVRK